MGFLPQTKCAFAQSLCLHSQSLFFFFFLSLFYYLPYRAWKFTICCMQDQSCAKLAHLASFDNRPDGGATANCFELVGIVKCFTCSLNVLNLSGIPDSNDQAIIRHGNDTFSLLGRVEAEEHLKHAGRGIPSIKTEKHWIRLT